MIDNNIIATLWQIVSILFDIVVIVFLITVIINLIISFFENNKKRKMKNQALNELQKSFDDLIKALEEQEKKKETKKLDKKKKE